MFDSMLSWGLNALSDGLDTVLSWVLSLMNMNVSFFINYFPIITTLYGVIQSVGIGLAIAIAAFQIFKFTTGSLNGSRSTPIEIMVRLGISIALIYFGNYILEAILNLFSYPHQALLSVTSSGEGYNNVFGNLALSSEISAIVALFFIVIVGWNIVKLTLEVVERFLMLGVLVYLSPLAWSAFSSRDSQPILMKYLSMFLGQCILMLLSVWSIKMVVNILGNSNQNIIFSMCVALAFCKIAQRFDTYIKSMGINAAHTGSSWLDDIMVAGKAITGLAGGVAKASGNNVLGDAIQKGGVMGGVTVGATQFGRFASSQVRNTVNKVTDSGVSIAKNKVGGGFTVTDAVGGLSVATKTRREANALSTMVQSTRAMYNGESNMTRDEKGMFSWTDANGQNHQYKDFNEAFQNQRAVRSQYDPSQVSRIDDARDASSVNNNYGNDNGVILNSSEPGDSINGLSNVYAGRVLNQDGSINENAVNGDSNTFNTNEGADTALTISALAGLHSLDKHTAQQMSEMSANTIATQGVSTASTLMNLKQGDGPITDANVIEATQNKLFDNTISKAEFENLAPGITEAMDNGTITNLHMGNGEIAGTFTDSNGMTQDYSIISESAYNGLSEEKQMDYQPIQGADGSMYYANVTESAVSSEIESTAESAVGSSVISETETVSGSSVTQPNIELTSPIESNSIESSVISETETGGGSSMSQHNVDAVQPIDSTRQPQVSGIEANEMHGSMAGGSSPERMQSDSAQGARTDAPMPVQSSHIQKTTRHTGMPEFNTSASQVELKSTNINNYQTKQTIKHTKPRGYTNPTPQVPRNNGKTLGGNNMGGNNGKKK